MKDTKLKVWRYKFEAAANAPKYVLACDYDRDTAELKALWHEAKGVARLACIAVDELRAQLAAKENELKETHARVWELQERVRKELEANAAKDARIAELERDMRLCRGHDIVAKFRAFEARLERAIHWINYWKPDETMVAPGYEKEWDETVKFIQNCEDAYLAEGTKEGT